MNEKPDYAFYVDEFCGNLEEEAFNAQLPGAYSYVCGMIGGKEVRPEQDSAFKRAICAAVEALATYGKGHVSGFSLGSFSFSGSETTGVDIAKQDAANELRGTGLLYGGLV